MKRVFTRNKSEEGSALVMAAVGVAVMAGMAAGIMIIGASSSKEQQDQQEHARSLYVAQAGISDALSQITRAEMEETALPTDIGEKGRPIKSARGAYWVDIEDNGDGTFTITSQGHTSGGRRALEVVARRQSGGAFANALYAGNSSGDPTYSLDFEGMGAQGDVVNGNVYSGQDINISQNAQVNGQTLAGGTISGASGNEGVSQPFMDLDELDYESNHDVDVLDEFLGGSSYRWDSMGGNAYQMPESSPAHIFRANPSDRRTEYQSTVKHDFFLEDPYESTPSGGSNSQAGAMKITLSGAQGKPGTDGSDKVYFIDGNLWIHNKRTLSMKLFDADGSPINVTFAVKGNIYFSDNVFYEDTSTDGIAFIAIEDDDVADSGNIYFGDPAFGTLEFMNGFMYAEHNFHDINLDPSGNGQVQVDGNMSCGNQFVVARTLPGGAHTKLIVNYDERFLGGEIELPGVPVLEAEGGAWEALSWREISSERVNTHTAGLLQ